MILLNKKVVITGGSIGLGRAIAIKFIEEGADIVFCARDKSKILETENLLRKLCSRSDQIIAGFQCDVSNEKEVRFLVKSALDKMKGLDVVVNNAGIYGPIGSSDLIDFASWRKSIEINLFGLFQLTQLAIKHFKTQGSGKIINLSGGGATQPMPYISSYAASKAAVVRLTETLAEENRSNNIDINAVAPGALNTRLLDQVLESGPQNVGKAFYEKALHQHKTGGAPLENGAMLCVFLASNKSDGITGKLISAIWDDWESFPDHLNELNQTDIFTLRRIIGKDRDIEWGEK